ncbi:YggS family pyridoxal phosphate-dependent enzyme [Clostridiisalibacter paucivorans]|uniref:YggS family pyridoxal phosphate-dependent enzyme n=1 Tax=Clostridiisalibacter paucivorans TaxID=408753 RepID=UPI00047D36C8|nr:YggS family pyridoxal phosphate-dependent enzyme [Clostridiisalibacter paucivorans]
MDLQKNFEQVLENINNAARRAGRKPEDITLIGVTKTVNEDVVRDALELGIKNIGENRVQEIQKKYDTIREDDDSVLHLIGHLQTNKVKYIVEKVDLIHSLDRLSLAKELQKRCKKEDTSINALIQVNIAEEESKFGLKEGEVITFIESLLEYDRINIKGLMTIAPYAEDPEDVRGVFKQLRELSQEVEKKDYKGVEMKYLSMGMTNDYEIAIEEGANMVRIGTALFGERIY